MGDRKKGDKEKVMLGFIFNKHALKKEEIKNELKRNKFSKYLPWVAYDEETKVYLNQDGSIGYIFECFPTNFASDSIYASIEGILRMAFPAGSVLQFILQADDYIEPILELYKQMRTRQTDLVKKSTEKFINYLKKGKKGLDKLGGTPVRNFRLFIAVKLDTRKIDYTFAQDIYLTMKEALKAAYLNPIDVTPEDLMLWLMRLINDMDDRAVQNLYYDDTRPISDQIILAETEIEKKFSYMRIGRNYWRCLTPKSYPKEITPLTTAELIGGIWGKISDMDQVKSPFLYTLNLIFEEMKAKLHAKCNLILSQQGVGSFAPSLKRKQEEYLWATDELEKGTKFVKVMPVLWVMADDDEKAKDSLVRLKRLWEGKNFVMQEDKGILPILFLSALPFGLYTEGNNVEMIDRDFIMPVDTASVLTPVQGDFAGGGKPVLIFIGRKGQLCSLDIFDKSADNHNIYIAASTGKGKSFLVNYLVFNYYTAGAKVRIIDIGGSYKKMTEMLGGRYLVFSEDSKICLNPFGNIVDEQNLKNDISVIAAIIMQMAYSATDIVPGDIAETANTLVKSAVKWAYEQEGTDAGIDTVFEYLNEFPAHADEKDLFECEEKEACAENLKIVAQTIAFNLKKFTSDGIYGQWFNGRSTFNLAEDEFIVLELEELKQQKELFKIITMQVINGVTADMYLGERERQKFVIFDEAWQFLRNNTTIKEVIEEGYRRARKYRGSFSIVTQSLLDLKLFGEVGDVINANSDFKFFLESTDFDKAKQEKTINYDDFTMKLLKSVGSNRPKYSEIFMDTPFGAGVARLVVDPYNYYVYTSDPVDNAKVENIVKEKGVSYAEACEMLARF